MNYRIHPAAVDELNEAIEFYESRERGSGVKLLDAVESAIQRVLRDPESFPAAIGNTRVVLVKKFPYEIIFRSITDCVEVYAVAHSSRRPAYWTDRLPQNGN